MTAQAFNSTFVHPKTSTHKLQVPGSKHVQYSRIRNLTRHPTLLEQPPLPPSPLLPVRTPSTRDCTQGPCLQTRHMLNHVTTASIGTLCMLPFIPSLLYSTCSPTYRKKTLPTLALALTLILTLALTHSLSRSLSLSSLCSYVHKCAVVSIFSPLP